MSAAGDLQAVIILFDNSVTTIDGDFAPTRIDAQKATVEVLAGAFIRGNRETVVGFGTLAGACGVQVSLTHDLRKVRDYLDKVKRDGTVHFERAVKCALFALRHRPRDISFRHLIIILGSKHDLTEAAATELAQLVNKEGVCLDFVVFGDDGIDMGPLDKFAEGLGSGSRYVKVPKSSAFLCDTVHDRLLRLSGDGGGFGGGAPMTEEAQLQQALRETAMDADEELQRALLLSLAENQGGGDEAPAPEDREQPQAADEDMDEELLAAIAMSNEENPSPDMTVAPANEGMKKEIDDFLATDELADIVAGLNNDGDDEKKKDEKKKDQEKK